MPHQQSEHEYPNESEPRGWVYWPFGLLSELPQVVVDADLDSPEIQLLLSKGNVRAMLLINAQGGVDDVRVDRDDGRPEIAFLEPLLIERFSKAKFVPGKVLGNAVPAAVPVTIGVLP